MSERLWCWSCGIFGDHTSGMCTELRCKSCGTPWSDHLGIEGTCKELESSRLRIKELEEALKCMLIGACAVAVPHDGERRVLKEAVDMARKALQLPQQQQKE